MAKGDLLARITKGASLDDPPEATSAPLAAAVMRCFTSEDYAFAVDGQKAPALEELSSLLRISPTLYALADGDRKAILSGRPTSELAPIAARLYPRFAGRNDTLGALTLQLFFDTSAALKTWESLYAEADGCFDIPRCAMLLEILRARADLLTPEFRETWSRHDEYLRARTLFADDYYRSAAYLERETLTDAFQSFWANPTEWVLRLFGKGGSGKTMFIRWLIARYCIPRLKGNDPIAVARVDFDFLNINAFAARPWLTLVPLARQLSPQLANNPFESLIREFSDLLPLLNSNEPLSPTLASMVDARRPSVESMFRGGLAANAALLVFDTCEEPLIHRKEAFTRLLELLANLHDNCPGLRLLLSGRYDIQGLPGDTAKAVGNFTRPESIRYLTELRHLPPGALTNAIARKSNGKPFSLGLFAELYHSPGGLTVREVRQAPTDDFVYLLDRVILRIPDEPVRWLVRYAVIPRELTFDFAASVLSRLLDDTSRDAANTFFGDLAKRYAARSPWPTIKFGELKKIWEKLVQYASNPSWISYNEAAQTIQLQPEVVAPMRKLLQEQTKLHTLLQRDAEKYWLKRAKAYPAEFVRCQIEALFHRFQRLGEAAGEGWRQLEANPRLPTAADRAQLGELILDSAFLDDKGQSLRHANGSAIVGPEIIARARFLVAVQAITDRLHRSRSSPSDGTVDKLAEQWHALSKQSSSDLLSNAEWTLVHQAHGIFVLRRFLKPTALRALRLPKAFQLVARMLAMRVSYERFFLGLPTDARDIAPALALSKQLKSTEFPPGHVVYRSALFHLRTGNLSKALPAFVEAIWKLPSSGPLSRDRVEAFWRALGILRATGRWREWQILTELVVERIKPEDSHQDALRFQYWLSRAALAIDLGEAEAAESFLKSAEATAGYDFAQAVWHDLGGELATLRLDLSAAIPHFNEAIKLYGPATNGGIRSTILTASFWLAAGNPAHARRILPKPPKDWQLAMEYAVVTVRLGGRHKTLPGPPAIRARLFATALAHGRARNPDRFFNELRGLSTDERLAALIPFGETGRRLADSARWQRHVKTQLPDDPKNLDGSIAVVQTIALANACRFFGDSERAGKLLAHIGPRKGIVELWRQRAVRSLQPTLPVPTELAFPHFPASPILEAVSRLERAEWLLDDGQLQAAAAILPPGEPLPQGTWLARHLMVQARLSDTHDAAARYRSAAEIATEAGAAPLGRRAAKWAEQAETSAPKEQQPLIRAVDEWTIEFSPSARNIILSFKLPTRGGGRFQHTSPKWLSNDLHALLELRDWPERVRELVESSTPFLQHTTAKGTRLRMMSGPAAALPFEYAAREDSAFFYRSSRTASAERETARWMQAALAALGANVKVTGHETDPAFLRALGHLTTADLRAALRQRNLDVLDGITVIEPDRDWQYSNKRGYLVQGLQLAAELGASHSEVPSVVDFSGVFRLDSREEPVLDCGEQREADSAYRPLFESGTLLRAEALAHRLLELPPRIVRPFVILDAIPAGEAEGGRLGLLRNIFCMRLFETGAARAVLGFGLAREGRARETMVALKRSFDERHSVSELHRSLLLLRDRFAFPPALWADDPDLPAYRS
jgi:hypothetical protein